MTTNANQIAVSKIYPGNYTNVLRYWHEEKTFQFRNANDTETSYTNQPIGGPVGVVFTLVGLLNKLLATSICRTKLWAPLVNWIITLRLIALV